MKVIQQVPSSHMFRNSKGAPPGEELLIPAGAGAAHAQPVAVQEEAGHPLVGDDLGVVRPTLRGVVHLPSLEVFKKIWDSYWSGVRSRPTPGGVEDSPSLEGFMKRLDNH